MNKFVEKMMNNMMSGQNKEEMMSKMMKNMMGESNCMDKMSNIPMIPQMAQEMMPKCLKMILPKIENDQREQFIMAMLEILFNRETAILSDENKTKLKEMVAEL